MDDGARRRNHRWRRLGSDPDGLQPARSSAVLPDSSHLLILQTSKHTLITMKLHKILLTIAAGFFAGGVANAQVDLTITGSTAFRAITFDRAASLMDPGFTTMGNTGSGPGSYRGTASNAVPSLGSTPVTIRLSFSGSGSGMLAVDQSSPVPTVDPITGNSSNRFPG